MSYAIFKALKCLRHKCITVQLGSGTQLTGFVECVAPGLLVLCVAGIDVDVIIAHIETFQEAEQSAC